MHKLTITNFKLWATSTYPHKKHFCKPLKTKKVFLLVRLREDRLCRIDWWLKTVWKTVLHLCHGFWSFQSILLIDYKLTCLWWTHFSKLKMQNFLLNLLTIFFHCLSQRKTAQLAAHLLWAYESVGSNPVLCQIDCSLKTA